MRQRKEIENGNEEIIIRVRRSVIHEAIEILKELNEYDERYNTFMNLLLALRRKEKDIIKAECDREKTRKRNIEKRFKNRAIKLK